MKFYQFLRIVLLQIHFGSGGAQIRNDFFRIRVRILILLKVLVPTGSTAMRYLAGVPRAQKKKTKRAAGSPAVSTQLALCLRLAYDV
jgi:hypothetical protein